MLCVNGHRPRRAPARWWSGSSPSPGRGRGGQPSCHPRSIVSRGCGGLPGYSSRATGHRCAPRGEKRRGRPDRGASWSPASPWARYRVRHRRTVWRSQRISAASRRLDGWSEAAARKSSRQRNAKAWGVECARASASNCGRSSSAKVTGGAYGTGRGATLVSCQVKQLCVLFENDRNPQSCPDKRLGRDLRNGHL